MIRVLGVFLTAMCLLTGVCFADGDSDLKIIGLTPVAESAQQWTGVAVSKAGRVFVNFPRWSPDVPVSVGELNKSGGVDPYPDKNTNSWTAGEDPAGKFVCVQSVTIDRKDRLWILDPANAWLQGVVPGGAKLLRVDLETNDIARTYVFDETIAPPSSYLNDVRVDTGTETAFITDSGTGALVVVDLASGEARRVLDNHPSVKAEATTVKIGGQAIPFVVHSDGIALDQDGGWLYYQALTGRTMYRIPTPVLVDATIAADELAGKVEKFAESGVSDGLLWTSEGIYVSSIEDSAIKRVNAEGKLTPIVQDEKIAWPDSFAEAPDGTVWFTVSQIHLGPNPQLPYRIFRIEIIGQ